MASELPKVRRVSDSSSPFVFALIAVVVILLGVIMFLLFSGSLFDDEPKSELELQYRALSEGLESNPENPAVLMTLAEVEYELGRKTEAIEHAEKGYEFGYDLAGIPLRYAQLMLQEDDFDKAREAIDREIELDIQQSNAEPMFLLAQIQRAEGDLDAALETMEQVLVIDYMAADIRLMYAEWLEEADRTDDAEEQYKRTLTFFEEGIERERALAGLERLGVSYEDTGTANPHDTPAGDEDQ